MLKVAYDACTWNRLPLNPTTLTERPKKANSILELSAYVTCGFQAKPLDYLLSLRVAISARVGAGLVLSAGLQSTYSATLNLSTEKHPC